MLSAFSDSRRFSSYTGCFLYSSYVRSTLQSININRCDQLFDCAIMVGHSFGYANTCCLDVMYEFDEKKAELFSYATFLSYIPYGKAGYDYIQKKLGDKPVWEYQYENALNTLTLDQAFLTNAEKAELKEYFRLLYQNKYKLDFIGFVSIIVKCNVLCYLSRLKNDYEYYGAIFDQIKDDPEREIDITEYLPPHKEITLTEAEIEEIEYAFKTQQNTKAHSYNLSKEQFSDIIHQRTDRIRGTGSESTGEVIHFLWDAISISGEITEVINDLNGGAPYLKFKLKKRSEHTFGPYSVDFSERILGSVNDNSEILVLLNDSLLYDSLYAYDQFLLTDNETGKMILLSCGYPSYQLVSTKEELIKYVTTSALPVANITMDEINALTDDDFLFGMYVIKGKCKNIQ